MVVVRERFYCANIRLFRWNENLFRNKVSDSEGLALFCITSSFKVLVTPHVDLGDEFDLVQNAFPIVVPFNLSELVAREENLGPELARRTQQFLSDTDQILGEQISTYLFTRFQIDPQVILRPNSAKTVIVVEVVRLRKILFDSVEDPDFGISKYLPLQNPPPRWASEDEDVVDDYKEDENDPWDSYPNKICTFLWGLRRYLGVARDWRTRRALTRDEPRGFVEIPSTVLAKPKEEFDRTVDTCAICLDGFVGVDDSLISTTCCFHVFHKHCITTWLFNKNSCPTCRLVLPLGFDLMN